MINRSKIKQIENKMAEIRRAKDGGIMTILINVKGKFIHSSGTLLSKLEVKALRKERQESGKILVGITNYIL